MKTKSDFPRPQLWSTDPTMRGLAPVGAKKIVRLSVSRPLARLHCSSEHFESHRFATTALPDPATGFPSSGLNEQTHNFGGVDHEYLSPCQPDRCLRRQHRLGIGQHCEVRATSPLQVKAPVSDRSLACDELGRPCRTSRIATMRTKDETTLPPSYDPCPFRNAIGRMKVAPTPRCRRNQAERSSPERAETAPEQAGSGARPMLAAH
jgi:hypothetical protein